MSMTERASEMTAKGRFSWGIYSKDHDGGGFQVFGDRLEVTPTGTLVFYQGDDVVHVQAPGTFKTCEILSAWDGCPTHAVPMTKPQQ
tara:strand:- start:360 stop:620 length:261 start_codon:yes stop_codon:yes gene_type:complete